MEFKHKKSLGQNFLKDDNLLAALASDAGITNKDNVLEIGPGLGALTQKLSKAANKVLSIEADNRLKEPLLAKFENSNVEFIFEDFLQVSFERIEKVLGKSYVVVANLPYYITTPILFRFFCEKNGATKIAVMVQKEVAERMCARPKSKDYGILSVACAHFGSPKIARVVGRHNFDPVPNVDSSFVVVPIDGGKRNNDYLEFVRTCFAMKRKTLINNLKKDFSQEHILYAFESCKISEKVRAEELSEIELEQLFLELSKNNKK